MKTLFIPAKSKTSILPVLKKVKLKGKTGTITTIQYLDQVKKLKGYIFGGQILGCNIKNAKKLKVDQYLFIGSGKFHPIYVALKLKKPVYIANPETNEFSKISDTEIQKLEKQLKGKLIKFHSAKKLGIIVSTKPGQNNIKQAIKLKHTLKKPSFIFITDNLNLDELENFPDIDCWINTACPRIQGKSIINYEDLP